MEQTTNVTQQKTNCALATAMRVIGVLNIIGGIVIGFNLCSPDGLFAGEYRNYNHIGWLCFVAAGVFCCIVCFAIAKCVQAATAYLNSVGFRNTPQLQKESSEEESSPKRDNYNTVKPHG